MNYLIDTLGIIFAAILMALLSWLISKPVDALINVINRRRADFPTLVVIAVTILEYVPFVLSFALAGTICYKVYMMVGPAVDVEPSVRGTFYVNTFKVVVFNAIACLVAVALAVALPYWGYRNRIKIPARWGMPLLCLVELIMIDIAVVLGLTLSIRDDSHLTISNQQIEIHHCPEYDFFFSKKPARDIIIPARQVVTWQMKAKYDADESVSSYTNLRIEYTSSDGSAVKHETLDMSSYSTEDQFLIHRLMTEYYP